MKRILIVERDIKRCLALSNLFNEVGFETGVADTTMRAYSMLAVADPLPDFILLDVKLSSIDNLVFKEDLQKFEAYKNIPVILMGEDNVATEVGVGSSSINAVVHSMLSHMSLMLKA